jgi:hypothetical protein
VATLKGPRRRVPSRSHPFRRGLLLVLLVLSAGPVAALSPAAAAAATPAVALSPARSGAVPAAVSKEYQVKAAFLFRFAQFVEWPESAFADERSPICIGVLGDDPFGSSLEEMVSGESVGRRSFVVRRFREPEEIGACHLLFVGRSEERRLPEVFAHLRSAGVLSVSDIEDFAQLGGVIRFYLDGSRVRFEINSEEAAREGLRISAQLLDLGRIVTAHRTAEGL